MKVISFSLFGDPNSFEFPFYLRGCYFNARMARLLYPGWKVQIYAHKELPVRIFDMLIDMDEVCGCLTLEVNRPADRCSAMLWRIQPLYLKFPVDPTHVICRDADAILTYRDAQAVQEWVDSGLGFHGITDDPAHTLPLMGGMVGIRTDIFKATFPEYDSFEKLTAGANLKDHGSDQNLLMSRIYPKAKGNMMGHFFEGCSEKVKIVKHTANSQIPGVNPKLWESNLTCRMIGSPGVVDFELLRFFKRFDDNKKFTDFERRWPVFYWHRHDAR